MSSSVSSTVPTMSTSGIYAVPPLTDKNWVEFKTKTVMSLTARSLSCYLDGTVKIPKSLPLSSDGTKFLLHDGKTEASETEIEENLVLLDAHAQKEALATQQLYAAVQNSIVIQVQSRGIVADIWKAICKIYEGKSDMVQVDTQARLQNMKCGENAMSKST